MYKLGVKRFLESLEYLCDKKKRKKNDQGIFLCLKKSLI